MLTGCLSWTNQSAPLLDDQSWLICIGDTTLPHKFIGTSEITAFQNISKHKQLATDEPGFERGIL